ncbi:hypothetical protein BDZ91DRAFT_833254 [Kalaharituber pfeilii]|nr:hypothetical protein BDZ91DRAFT_833254 [Kalaharituber pfeilii]
MSFGFGVGDFLAVGQLAWKLYDQCYRVARGAPQDFRTLVDDLRHMWAVMQSFAEELKDPTSIFLQSGEERQCMLLEMLNRVRGILNQLQDIFEKHRNLGNSSRSGIKGKWDKFKWSIDAKEVDSIRHKVSYRTFCLLLLHSLTNTCVSSLQRIEKATHEIDNGLRELKGYLRRVPTGSLAPSLTAPAAPDTFFRNTFSERCMKLAQVTQPWTAIGVEEWIKAGRWWLLRAGAELESLPAQGDTPKEPFVNLLKASWILIDIITSHPQFGYIDQTVRYDVQNLTEVISIPSLCLRCPDEILTNNDRQSTRSSGICRSLMLKFLKSTISAMTIYRSGRGKWHGLHRSQVPRETSQEWSG